MDISDRKSDFSERILTERQTLLTRRFLREFWQKMGKFLLERGVYERFSDRKTGVSDKMNGHLWQKVGHLRNSDKRKATFLRKDKYFDRKTERFWGEFWQKDKRFLTERWRFLTGSGTFSREFWQKERTFLREFWQKDGVNFENHGEPEGIL